jgi:hypothetical protein
MQTNKQSHRWSRRPLGYRRHRAEHRLTRRSEHVRPVYPDIVDRVAWQRKIDELRLREKAHSREGDAAQRLETRAVSHLRGSFTGAVGMITVRRFEAKARSAP